MFGGSFVYTSQHTPEFGNVGYLTLVGANSTVPTVSFLHGAEPFEGVNTERKETPQRIEIAQDWNCMCMSMSQ